ncbi:META domain-containing protein [Thalassococcus profundi]|jgi:heat shock protein HslJ|uniref:META domain-containing protein n=1 Tax=Thalassococcus profundi TaxID=2282382 RepID=A0A369TNT0_9RHOB|nr:META domain-containing protein [Thalassococcus profundi]RDD66364.1 META domain-containing protein [Thalassococcus profundi]
MRIDLLLSIGLLAACSADETVFSYGAGERTFAVQSIDGDGFDARATLSFPEPGRIAGRAPCNAYSGAQLVPYPWFEAGEIIATKMACPDLAAEAAYFEALAEMALVKVEDGTMRLWNDAGREIVLTEVAAE